MSHRLMCAHTYLPHMCGHMREISSSHCHHNILPTVTRPLDTSHFLASLKQTLHCHTRGGTGWRGQLPGALNRPNLYEVSWGCSRQLLLMWAPSSPVYQHLQASQSLKHRTKQAQSDIRDQ